MPSIPSRAMQIIRATLQASSHLVHSRPSEVSIELETSTKRWTEVEKPLFETLSLKIFVSPTQTFCAFKGSILEPLSVVKPKAST